MQELPLIARACPHSHRIALRSAGREYRYSELLEASEKVACSLLGTERDLAEKRIAFMAPAGFEYVAMQWGIWRAGGVAIPLSLAATAPELSHVLDDSQTSAVLCSAENRTIVEDLCETRNLPLSSFEAALTATSVELPEIAAHRRAMILYTSGTTSKPKGVVTTHANIRSQIEALVIAWEWRETDCIPLFLPMHHIHGIINITCCALWSGATIEAFPRFDATAVLQRVAARAYTLFMAVPTIYVKLIELFESAERIDLTDALRGFSAMRLMVSGSAALPPSIHRKWTALTGQSLLERYGMTETAMTLSNPLHGERRPGAVGQPLPGVEVRLKAEGGAIVSTPGEPGEIQVRGPVVFREYWNQPQATEQSFDDGWFCTGDMGVMEDGYYRILGRMSVDIIKSGGYKLSALEIEAALLEHPAIRECAVVGLHDDTWGEAVAVAVALEEGAGHLEIDDLRHWSKDRLSHYKMPRRLLVVDSLPRNAMGKVTKRAVGELLQDASPEHR